jgi:hypothetical protein
VGAPSAKPATIPTASPSAVSAIQRIENLEGSLSVGTSFLLPREFERG